MVPKYTLLGIKMNTETETLRMRDITRKDGSCTTHESVCVDCEKEGYKVDPISIEDLGQWTYLYQCPRCKRTSTEIDDIGMRADGVI